MNDKPEKVHLFDKPRNVKRLTWALFAVCAASVALDFVLHRHVDHPWENLSAFYAIYGFLAYCGIVFGAAALRKILMRKEDYYDD